MLRSLYLLGSVYLLLSGAVLVTVLRNQSPRSTAAHSATATPYSGPAGEWFARLKPNCNAVEVETALRQSPPPASAEGAGYGAACYALAGRIDQARALILDRARGDRAYAASIVFNIGHPVADAGDDRSAGPIMELVLEFWPENYMALYHAGMSEYTLGQLSTARQHLERFLELYKENDGWHSNAVTVLDRLR